MKTLIVFGTCEGQTQKIASFMQAELLSKGIKSVLHEPGKDSGVEAENFDSFIIGGPVHGGKYPKALQAWVKDHNSLLNSRLSVFFSVCLGILQTTEAKVIAEEHKSVQDFFGATGWRPKKYEIFAGALKYSKYNWLMKRIMRSIALKAGQETQMNRDYEYTDWNKVIEFTKDFSNQIEKLAVPSPTGLPLTSTV